MSFTVSFTITGSFLPGRGESLQELSTKAEEAYRQLEQEFRVQLGLDKDASATR
jgi:hypothetical protein